MGKNRYIPFFHVMSSPVKSRQNIERFRYPKRRNIVTNPLYDKVVSEDFHHFVFCGKDGGLLKQIKEIPMIKKTLPIIKSDFIIFFCCLVEPRINPFGYVF